MKNMVDYEWGGCYGRIDGYNQLQKESSKGAVMNCRILWTFSAAYRVIGDERYLSMAKRAFEYITTYFIDEEFGGVYWSLDHKGNPLQTKKQLYAQGFALYAFSEYYRVTQDPVALEKAIEFFHLIEKCKDQQRQGYYEAFNCDWQPVEDMRLSEKDENLSKTMNTHLHILESYTNLLRIWTDSDLIIAQKELIEVFVTKIYNSATKHLNLFFNDEWDSSSATVSYGHDIEAVWLLWEAAEVLNDSNLQDKVREVILDLGQATLQGLQSDGSLAYECKNDHLDLERHWWVQAEAVVGFRYLYEISNNPFYLRAAQDTWKYIQQNLIDKENGEWFWSRFSDGFINRKEDKAGFWKCPYHNSRMCLEMIENFNYSN